MTQEELAKKWAENYEADVAVHVYDAILAALQEQEKIHPWADAEERAVELQARLDKANEDFAKLAAKRIMEAREQDDLESRYKQVLDDFQKEVSGWDNGVYAGTREDWIDRCYGTQRELDELRDELHQQAMEKDLND